MLSTRHKLNHDEYGFIPMYQAAMCLMEEVGSIRKHNFAASSLFLKFKYI